MSHPKYAYFDGEIVPWQDASLHVFSPAVKYGAGVFEGLRAYWNADAGQLYVFRLAEHLDRLGFSQTAMRIAPQIDLDRVGAQILELLRANEVRENVHIRATVFVDGGGDMGARGPALLAITAVPRETPERLADGVTAQVSSWRRIPDRSMPMRVKANANYNNARFAVMQANDDGYDTAIFLNDRGKVSEGPGMCLFIVRDGVPITPSITSDILESITRETVLELFRDHLDAAPVERDVDRSELMAADEAFFCGTGWEVTPLTAIDRVPVGGGTPGPLTRALQSAYFDIVHGRVNSHAGWRTAVWE